MLSRRHTKNFSLYSNLTLIIFILINIYQVSTKSLRVPRSSPDENENGWSKWNKCPPDSFVTGVSLKLRKAKDSSNITGVRFYCTRQHVLSERDNDFVDTIIQIDPEGQPSHWFKPVFCDRGVGTEFSVKQASINGQRIVTNIRLTCSDGEILKTHGHGKDDGDWTESSKCSPRHAICGLQTQVAYGGVIFTDARVHCCNVHNPATKCVLTDKWHHVTDCKNAEAIVPESCEFDRKIGTSYAGKERETSIYENLGYTLNGVATDLSGKVESMEPVSITTGYSWASASHETWMPETKTKDIVVAQPGTKSSLYQVVAYCGFYRIRSMQFKIDSSQTKRINPEPEVDKSGSSNPHIKINPEEKHKGKTLPKDDEHDPNIQADWGDNEGWDEEWNDDTDKENHEHKSDTIQENIEQSKKNSDEKKESIESFEDWEDSEEKPQVKVEIPPEPKVEDVVEDLSDDWNESEEEESESKPKVEDSLPVAPASAKSSEEKDSKDNSKNDKGHSEGAKLDTPVAPVPQPSESEPNTETEIHDAFNNDPHISDEKIPEVKIDTPLANKESVENDVKASAEKLEETKAVEVPHHEPESMVFNSEDKNESIESFENWEDSEEKPQVKVEIHPEPKVEDEVKGKNDLSDDWSESEEEESESKPKVEDSLAVAPASVKSSEEDNSKNDKGHSEGTKLDTPVAPIAQPSESKPNTETEIHDAFNNDPHTSDKKIPEVKIDTPLAKKESVEDDVLASAEKLEETKAVEVPHHEPKSMVFNTEDKKESLDSFGDQFEDSEEKTHEAKVVNSVLSNSKPSKDSNEAIEDNSMEHNDNTKDVKKSEENKIDDQTNHIFKSLPPPNDLDSELMAKDLPNDHLSTEEWGSDEFAEPEKEVGVIVAAPVAHPIPEDDNDSEFIAKDLPNDHLSTEEWGSDEFVEPEKEVEVLVAAPVAHPILDNDHTGHMDTETVDKVDLVPVPAKENIKMAEAAPGAVADEDYDWGDDFSVDIPETKHNDKISKHNDETVDEKHDLDDKHNKIPSDFLAPIMESIDQGISEINKTLQDAKDSAFVKDVEKGISEFLDAGNGPKHDSQSSHQDDVPNINKEPSENSASTASPDTVKVQSAILGYIVGGMVAAVVIIVIVIFVLERRQPKRYPEDADRNVGQVRDQPLLSVYEKDIPLAVNRDKDAF